MQLFAQDVNWVFIQKEVPGLADGIFFLLFLFPFSYRREPTLNKEVDSLPPSELISLVHECMVTTRLIGWKQVHQVLKVVLWSLNEMHLKRQAATLQTSEYRAITTASTLYLPHLSHITAFHSIIGNSGKSWGESCFLCFLSSVHVAAVCSCWRWG